MPLNLFFVGRVDAGKGPPKGNAYSEVDGHKLLHLSINRNTLQDRQQARTAPATAPSIQAGPTKGYSGSESAMDTIMKTQASLVDSCTRRLREPHGRGKASSPFEFERHAGMGANKRQKSSMHRSFRMPSYSQLGPRHRAALFPVLPPNVPRMVPPELQGYTMVDHRICIYWWSEKKYLAGTVTDFDDSLHYPYRIDYDDGYVDHVNLNEESWHLDERDEVSLPAALLARILW
ncbi:hypothetical protein VOLCADRAFT_91052 [Volvox carteri f. nagariensis]|uniref:Tudor domain-containing protein n=1 Tax=Volvox carteri f. nagariensis TaxID=3068 RepID=D8TW21_VOLCA|nr:uncharacterized protein VOLCADRAFT_91052 [Volvox carteri f. nagariensis]EFJ48404.1 hypothetical protein VOLCADRAFT_91052 [Volvox carteri f. nagariensis]|eukprot:XP_002950658.1 hypothetical protein VOLCADRAFT_91052 [Volvox carteri f. nagariensis]